MLNVARPLRSLSFCLSLNCLHSINEPQQVFAARHCAISSVRYDVNANRHSSVHFRLLRKSSYMSQMMLKGRVDRFNGVTVDSSHPDVLAEAKDVPFVTILKDSLKIWAKEGRRGIWFKVYLKDSEWVPCLVKEGFTYHHAKQDYVMLLKWLPELEAQNIPGYAHTMIGVGAVVVNENDEVLVVREQYYRNAQWKLPGGYVEPGENLVDAAIREVYEETNIHTEFRSLIAFRHGHGGQFNCSDLYTVVSLKPLSNKIVKCDREIQDSMWMPLSEYMQHPEVDDLNCLFVQCFMNNRRKQIGIQCHHGIHQMLKKPYTVYFAAADYNYDKSVEVTNK